MNEQPNTISWADFERIELRVGTIVSAESYDDARKPAIKLWIDFGELGEKKSSAQITKYYDPTALVGRQVIAITNFPPKQIGSFRSEVLVTGLIEDDGGVVLIGPDRAVKNGIRLA